MTVKRVLANEFAHEVAHGAAHDAADKLALDAATHVTLKVTHALANKRVNRPATNARGFTLIEVLIALAIVAIALASAMRAVGSVATGTQALHARLLAGWSADNRLTELHLEHAWPAFGVTSFACPQGNVALTCIQTVTATPNPLFRRIEVSVRSPDTGTTLLADLVTVVADETRRSL